MREKKDNRELILARVLCVFFSSLGFLGRGRVLGLNYLAKSNRKENLRNKQHGIN